MHMSILHTHFLRQQVDVLFVAAFRSIVQLYQSQSLGEKEQEISHHDNSKAATHTHFKCLGFILSHCTQTEKPIL